MRSRLAMIAMTADIFRASRSRFNNLDHVRWALQQECFGVQHTMELRLPYLPRYLISDDRAHGNYLVQTCCPPPGLPLLDEKKQER